MLKMGELEKVKEGKRCLKGRKSNDGRVEGMGMSIDKFPGTIAR
jgi:hypothetical protein